MKFYEEKMAYLLSHQKHICALCGQYCGWDKKIDLDHYRIKNHKNLRRRFPLVIDSLLNLRAVANSCHVMKNERGLGPVGQDKLERFLERHEKIATWVNAPTSKLFSKEPYE